MKQLAVLVSLVVCSILLAGCGPREWAPSTPAEQAVSDAVEYYDGAERLLLIKRITGRAVVTVYDEAGAGRVRGHEFVIYPRYGRIEAAGRVSGGKWRASVTLDGDSQIRVRGDGTLSSSQREQITRYLRLILHRVRGPLNLMGGGEQSVDHAEVFVAAYSLDRVLADGRTDLASAYFFDAKTGELRMVTAGDYEIPGAGTVTLYENAPTKQGVVLPSALQVVALGDSSFVGDRKILSVRFENLEIR